MDFFLYQNKNTFGETPIILSADSPQGWIMGLTNRLQGWLAVFEYSSPLICGTCQCLSWSQFSQSWMCNAFFLLSVAKVEHRPCLFTSPSQLVRLTFDLWKTSVCSSLVDLSHGFDLDKKPPTVWLAWAWVDGRHDWGGTETSWAYRWQKGHIAVKSCHLLASPGSHKYLEGHQGLGLSSCFYSRENSDLFSRLTGNLESKNEMKASSQGWSCGTSRLVPREAGLGCSLGVEGQSAVRSEA